MASAGCIVAPPAIGRIVYGYVAQAIFAFDWCSAVRHFRGEHPRGAAPFRPYDALGSSAANPLTNPLRFPDHIVGAFRQLPDPVQIP